MKCPSSLSTRFFTTLLRNMPDSWPLTTNSTIVPKPYRIAPTPSTMITKVKIRPPDVWGWTSP